VNRIDPRHCVEETSSQFSRLYRIGDNNNSHGYSPAILSRRELSSSNMVTPTVVDFVVGKLVHGLSNMFTPSVVVLVGKLGHGKTFLLNKLTGTRHPSSMGARSCTQTLQTGYSQRYKEIMIVDTPGFGSSDDIAAHIAAQKLALEGTALSGVYIVAKYARADEIAEFVSTIMSFLGDDDVRVIVTWADTAREEIGYDPQGTRVVLSQLLGINIANIVVVEKQTEEAYISNFIKSTVHRPRYFNISDEQVARISSLCITTRKFNKAIEEVYAKIAAASKACADVTAQ